MENISQSLKELCNEKDINLKQLAPLVGIEDSLLYKYANNVSTPTLSNLCKLVNHFDCTINFMLGLDETPKSFNVKQNYDKSLFYPRYKALLQINGLSNYKVCKALEISQSSHLNWKNGAIPYLDTLFALAKYFDTSVDYLIGKSDEK